MDAEPVVIRRATHDDLDDLLHMYAPFLEGQFALQGFGRRNLSFDVRSTVRRRLDAPDFVVLVAQAGSRPAGFCECSVYWAPRPPADLRSLRSMARWLRQRWRLPPSSDYVQPHLEGYLHNLYVVPAVRGRGVGRALTRAAIDELQERKAEVLYLHTLAANTEAQRMFAAEGFTAARILMRRLVDSAPSPIGRA